MCSRKRVASSEQRVASRHDGRLGNMHPSIIILILFWHSRSCLVWCPVPPSPPLPSARSQPPANIEGQLGATCPEPTCTPSLAGPGPRSLLPSSSPTRSRSQSTNSLILLVCFTFHNFTLLLSPATASRLGHRRLVPTPEALDEAADHGSPVNGFPRNLVL